MKKIILCFALLIFSAGLRSQISFNQFTGTQIVPCGVVNDYYDSGGSGANYSPNEDYTLTLVPSTAGQCLQLTFTTFSTEACCDWIRVYDGANTGAPLVGQYGGLGTAIPVITSTSGSLTIYFHSDFSIEYAGWTAQVQCVACPPPPPPVYLMNVNAVTSVTCPAFPNLIADDGGIAGNYSNSQNWTRTFTAPAGQCLQFQFSSVFGIEACCDFLRVYDGPSGASPLIGTYNGFTAPGIITSSGSSLTFSFTSDASVVYAGFSGTLSCVAACTGTPAGGTGVNNATGCPAAGFTNLSASGAGTGCGITWQWQSGPTTLGPWTNVAGANQATLTVPTSTNTYYTLKTCCGVNCATSTPVSASTFTLGCPLSTYVASPVAYSFDVFGGIVCPSTDDVIYNNTAIFGFPFCYTGAKYWGGYIASNGSFVFNAVPCFPNVYLNQYVAPGIGTGFSISAAAPSQVNAQTLPQNAINGPWQDINPGLGGVIRYTTIGLSPNRRFVVSYENIPMFSCGTSSPSIYFTGQIKLFETSGNIEIHVGNKGICPGWNSGAAIMGLTSHDGLTYVPPVNMVAHNFPTQWNMANTAYRFTSPCATTTGPCAVLPINFKSFYAERIDRINKLYWETSEEKNIQTFIVERSFDAQTFTELAKVNPKNTPGKYQYDDKSAMPGTINYYRITSVEKDGQRNSTEIYPLGSKEGEIAVSSIYPNPVKTDFFLGIDSKIETTIYVTVYDAFGKIVKTFAQNVGTGASQLNLFVEDLRAGIYLLETTNSNKEVVMKQKLMKVD